MAESNGPLILMVEDDQLLSSIVAQKFVKESLQVERAASAEEAMQVLQQPRKPDLLLLDIHLPGENGFEFLEQIRAMPEFAKLPVIVLSNFNAAEDLQRGKELGVLRHVQKVTLTPAEIVDMVRDTLKARTP